MDWELTAALDRDRFVLGEPVLVELAARYLGAGFGAVPSLRAGEPRGPVVHWRKDGGEERLAKTALPAQAPHVPGIVRSGQTVRGELELGSVIDLEAGAYEVNVLVAGAHAGPVRFVVEECRAQQVVAAPVTADGTGQKLVLWSEGGKLVLVLPGEPRGALVVGSLAAVDEVAVAVLPASGVAMRPWVVARSGRELHRWFVDAEPAVRSFDPFSLPFEGKLVAGLAGADDQLHVAFVSGDELAGVTPGTGRVDLRDLPTTPVAVRALPLSGGVRAFVVARAEGDSTAVFLHEWTESGIGGPELLLRFEGSLLALDAVSPEEPVLRLAVLALGRERELVLHEVRDRVVGSSLVPDRHLESPGLALLGEETFVTGVLGGKHVAFPPGEARPWLSSVAAGSWCDFELDAGSLASLSLDAKRGLLALAMAPTED